MLYFTECPANCQYCEFSHTGHAVCKFGGCVTGYGMDLDRVCHRKL